MKKKIALTLAMLTIIASLTTFADSKCNGYDYSEEIYGSSQAPFWETTDKEDKEEYILGDLDRNGKVDSTDYLRIKRCFLGYHSLKGTEFAMADVDFDGEITSTDYLKIKNSFLQNEPLDDSAWAEQKEKPDVKFNDFAIEFSDNSIYEDILPSHFTLDITNGKIAYPDDFKLWPWYKAPAKTIIHKDRNGVDAEFRFSGSSATNLGSIKNTYSGPSTYDPKVFTDYKGEYRGFSNSWLVDTNYISNSGKKALGKNTLREIAAQRIAEEFPGEIFKLELEHDHYGEGNMTYLFDRYINNVHFSDGVVIAVNIFGEVYLIDYSRTILNELDTRSINVNTDKSVYDSKVIPFMEEYLEKNSKKYNIPLLNGKLDSSMITIETSKLYFKVAYDGSIAGYYGFRAYDKETGKQLFYKIVSFYAIENEPIKAE